MQSRRLTTLPCYRDGKMVINGRHQFSSTELLLMMPRWDLLPNRDQGMHKPSQGCPHPHSRPQHEAPTAGHSPAVLWGAARGRMRAPCNQPPNPMDLPQGPPVPAVPSAQGHRLRPARGVLASAHAALGREHPAPPRPLPGAARDLQASFVMSAASIAPLSPLKAGAGTPHPTSQVPPGKALKPGLHPHQGQSEPARSSYGVSFGTSGSLHPSWTLGKSKGSGWFGRRGMLLTVLLCG